MRGVRPLEPVERRLCEIHVPEVDERAHVPEQEREQECRDVLAIDIRVGHEHDLVVPGLVRVELLADPSPEGRDHRLHLVVGEGPIEPGLLDVEDLATQREDRLRLRVASLHGGTAGRVALDDEDLGDARVTARAVPQLARHAAGLEKSLAPRLLARLACRHPGRRGLDRLADDVPRLGRVAVEPVVELVPRDALDEALRLGVAELGLRLSLELRFGELDGDDGRESFPDVVSREVLVLLLEDGFLSRVLVDERRERRAEALLVGPALVRVDRVRVGVHALEIGIRPLHRDLDRDLALCIFRLEGDYLLVERLDLLGRVEVLDVVDESLLVEVHDRHGLAGSLEVALVDEGDREPLVEEGDLLETGAQGLEVEVDRLESVRARPERDDRPGALDGLLLLERCLRDPVPVLLAPRVAHPVDFDGQPAREGVDDRHTDAVQAPRNRVASPAELSTGVEDRHDDLDARLLLLLVLRDRDATAVVDDPDSAILGHRHDDLVAVAGERLIDRVVDDLVHEVVQAARAGGSDVHAWTLAHRLKAFENLDLVCTVTVVRLGGRGLG